MDSAWASGGSTHILASELALDRIASPGLRRLLNADAATATWAAWYPDGGYVVDDIGDSDRDDYGEISHWGRFQEIYWNTVTSPYHNPEELPHVLGVMSHGLGDEIFDSIFMDRGQRLGEDVSRYDVGVDMFVIREQRRYGQVERGDLPVPPLVETYNQMGLDGETIGRKIQAADQILWAGIKGEGALSLVSYDEFKALLPWANQNYMEAPGGVLFMADWIAQFWQARWQVYRGAELEPYWPVITRFPERNAQLSQTDPVYGNRQPLFVFFGLGMYCPQLRETSWFAVDQITGSALPLTVSNIYSSTYCHLIRLDPTADWPDRPFQIITADPLSSWDLALFDQLGSLPEF